MSRLSIKQRVTAFYAAVMLLFLIIIMTVFYVTLDLQITYVSHSALEKSVKNAFDYIDTPGDWLEISNDFDFYVNDVTLLVYGEEGTKIMGHAPQGFPQDIVLQSDKHHEYEREGDSWQVYDLYTEFPNGTGIWVRGIYSLTDNKQTLGNILNIMLLAFPLLIGASLFVGYLVTSRAFAPIRRIQETAERIIIKNDLSERIGLDSDSNDELYKLAATYDKLLERIETAFENEKQFTSDVSHELRTPVSVIISQAEYGLDQGDQRTMRESLESILHQSEHMSNLITQLLELSRTGNVLRSLKYEQFNLSELCEMVIDELREQASNRGIQIISKLDREIEIIADQTQLMRALINLISNSISYGHDGGFAMLDLHRDVTNEDQVIINISDDGVGIAPEHLDKIFNRFYQADPSRTKQKYSNTGLGLPMVKQIIEAHGGKISVQSSLGAGSTFTVIIPAAVADNTL